MRIEQDLKLDFSDVLIKPKRSENASRADVNLKRNFHFLNSKSFWEGCPVIASNMDTVGTFSIHDALYKEDMLTCLHKFYSLEELKQFYTRNVQNNAFYTIGTRKEDFDKLLKISDSGIKINKICIDVANGYTDIFVKYVRKVRELFKDSIIMAGNVVTGEMVQEIVVTGGADIVKIGIGSGCFIPGTIIKTVNKFEKIENIRIGDLVLTHKGRYKKVVAISKRKEKETTISINGNKSTGNHEYYVLHKKYKNIVNDDNVNEYAEWIPANKITKDHFLLKNTLTEKTSLTKYELVEINDIHEEPYNDIVYDFEVEEDHSYVVGKEEIIVHNSVCLTRTITGCGYPQLSSIIECADVAHGLMAHICSDGGCREAGDVVKAFAAGADFVMLGGMLSGHDECEGKWICDADGVVCGLEFYGMSSETANIKYNGGLKDYRAAEGKKVIVPAKGPVANTLQQITGGIRSACAYVGAKKLKDLSKCTTFIRVNKTHDNYR